MQDKIERLHFMDSMRAILMMLGVVLHSAQIFNPEQSWVVYSNKTDPIMTYIVNIIGTFRMPAFFVVSGYFCFLTLKKYQVRKFLTVRLTRLIIPFFFTALLINSLQATFLNWTGWRPFEFSEYLMNGGYVSHLWFLINLTVYFLVAGLVVVFFKPGAKLGISLARQTFNKVPILLIVILMPLFSLVILSLNKVGFPLYSSFFGIINIFSILLYSPFFIFGVALATQKDFLRRFCSINPIVSLFFLIISLIVVNFFTDADGKILMHMKEYFTTLSKWFSVLVCFFIFYRFFNRQSKPMRMLSDSAYTVYLFHHIFVIALGVFLMYLDFSAIFICVVLITLVNILTLVIHNYIISNNKALLFMFNGK